MSQGPQPPIPGSHTLFSTLQDKTDDFTREDFHLIKHVKITHFQIMMGIAGTACAWKVGFKLRASKLTSSQLLCMLCE